MEQDASGDNTSLLNDFDERPRSAVNSVVLDYYKKFGRKRDLEQYFSLSTAQNDIRDPRSLFWRRMKEQSDTSDSGEKKSESSNEICKISIKCSIPVRSDAEKGDLPSNNDSESPPIITDPQPEPSGDESIDENHSHKSADGTLDTSMNKPLSPTSSITSQRKLEWDSLADVGYANESDRKTSASSLSTLEREVLAQKQQYTLDYKQSSDLGLPTAHSTPVDPSDGKSKGKKGQEKKTISISRKDVDFVEVSVPHDIEKVQPINVNLTKQFSVNLQKDGGMTVDNIKKDITISPEKNVDFSDESTGIKVDKEIQTSLLRPKEKDQSSVDCLKGVSSSAPASAPILICLNTLRRMQRRKKMRKSRSKLKSKKKTVTKKIIHEKDKNGEQVSEAESFEYMPGHIYNQNQLNDPTRPNNNNNNVGNKSSLESSAVHTTDSSKESKYSFNKDLDKTLNVLKSALKEKYDSNLKKKLVTEIIHRLLKSNYGEGEKTPGFLSDLSLTSKKAPTTSTSEADDTEEKVVHCKPKKSILRVNKFDPNNVASTSQSAPNIPSVVNSNKPVASFLSKLSSSTTTETDLSNNSAKDVTSSDTVFAKTSSEELYKKYIDALKREEAYKQHLRDKELFLRQKLVKSETALKVPMQLDVRTNIKLKELIKDLTRNNYDDGSGDASKLEGGSSSNFDINRQRIPRKHRSHSVFTLSSGNSDVGGQNCNLKNRFQKEIVHSPRAGPSNGVGNLSGSCNRPAVTDSSVQVNINHHDNILPDNLSNVSEEAKYVCFCTERTPVCRHRPDEMAAYKCPNTIPMNKPKVTHIINQPARGIHAVSSSLEDDIQTSSYSGHHRKQKTILECTRCLQTKISIHPKISDPSVSDLNIIHSTECVKLINELYRKVSQTSSECQCSNEKDDCNSYTCKSSKDNMRRYDRNERDNLIAEENEMAPLTDRQTVEQNVTQLGSSYQKTVRNHPESILDNIVIPIQGTNMMLKVSIGGKTMKVEDEDTPKEDHRTKTFDAEIVTDKIKTSLKGTSILDECSKSVQAENPDDINKNPADAAPCDVGPNEEKGYSPRKTMLCGTDKGDFRKNDKVFKPDAVHALGCSTYPKTMQIHDKKPFVRSNTDTGKLGASSAIQTDTIYNEDKETQPCFRVDMKQGFQPVSRSPGKQSRRKGDCQTQSQGINNIPTEHSVPESSKSSSGERFQSYYISKNISPAEQQQSKELIGFDTVTDEGKPKDLILDVITDITKRYSKRDIDKRNKKKCFKEIMTALSYLLDTDDSGDGDQEFIRQSQRPKGVQHSRELSSQSELVANNFLNEKPRKNSASYQKGENVAMLAAHESDKFVNVFPLKSMRNKECEENMTLEAKLCENSSKTSEDTKSNAVFSKSEQAALICDKRANEKTCKCGCRVADCKDCMAPHYKEFGSSSSGKESCNLENQKETYNSCKENETGTLGKTSLNPTKQEPKCSLPKKAVSTCDKGCGCDGSSECKECGQPHSPKDGTGTCNKDSAGPKNQEARSNSAKQRKTTCDRGCGCGSAQECKDCSEPHSLKNKTGKCCKESMKSRKQERSTSPTKIKTTCDKGCGYDSSLECTECDDPQSPNYSIGKCGKKSLRSKIQEKCISCNEPKTTCDKACGCDGNSECKECNDKTGRCGKEFSKRKKQVASGNSPKKFVNRCVQSTVKRVKSLYSHCDDSSDVPVSTDPPCCSTDSPTAKLVNKIRKECDKYQKRCKATCKKCEASSSTAVSCDHCKRARHDHCRRHKCKCHRTRSTERVKKKCVAYNLIVQTSDSMISEETIYDKCRPLQNVIVRVPKCKQGSMTFKEACAKIERKLPHCSTSFEPKGRSQSWPNECGISSTDDVKMAKACTVREYLERNRPDFVDRCATRQNCIRLTSETRAKDQSKLREQLVGLESLPSLNNEELIYLAKELGIGRRRSLQQKIMSEREMKKHSEKIYKKLPEVVQKKEEAKKESVKKTNFLIANIFKKNLQKKTLKGDVNISNYSQVVKI